MPGQPAKLICCCVNGCVLFSVFTGPEDETLHDTTVATGIGPLGNECVVDTVDDWSPRPVWNVVEGDLLFATDGITDNWLDGTTADNSAMIDLGYHRGLFEVSAFVNDVVGAWISIFAPGGIEARWTVTEHNVTIPNTSLIQLTVYVDGVLTYTGTAEASVGQDQGVMSGTVVITDTEVKITESQANNAGYCALTPTSDEDDTTWGVGSSNNTSTNGWIHGLTGIRFWCPTIDTECIHPDCDGGGGGA